jgi:threonine dehydratase
MTVKLSDIEDAQKILKDIIIRTPLVADGRLSRDIGAKAFLKAECLQKSGSFKIRGAYNKIHRLTDEEKARGVIAASAGNHAQGVALAARMHNIKATVVLPKTAPLTKITATERFGADVPRHGTTFEEAVAFSRVLQEEHGYTYVHAFNDELVIAGQGTIGLEIAEDCAETSVIVVPIGGGGVISGIAIAAKSVLPNVRIIGVQAENAAAMRRSVEAGEPLTVDITKTIADGIAVKTPGEVTLPIIKEFVDEIVEVTEDEIASAISFCVQNNRLVVEGAGAAGLAALLAKKIRLDENDTVCAVLTGGNIDANLLARVLEQDLVLQGRYIILKFLIDDQPGALAEMLNSVAESEANVIEIIHHRAMWLVPLNRAGIELVLEVRDEKHGREVVRHLRDAGYHVSREGVTDWEE